MRRSTDRILTTHVGSLARPRRAARHDEGAENGRPYDHDLFDRQVTRRGRRPGAPAGRGGHRHRHRRRDEQGQLPRLREGPPRWLRGRHGRVAAWPPSWQKEVDDFPEYYAEYFKKYSATVSPLRRIICNGPDQLRRPGAAADRHRQPEGGHRRRTTWPTCSCRPPARAGSAATSTTPRTRSTCTRWPRPCARSTSPSSPPGSSSRSTTRS